MDLELDLELFDVLCSDEHTYLYHAKRNGGEMCLLKTLQPTTRLEEVHADLMQTISYELANIMCRSMS